MAEIRSALGTFEYNPDLPLELTVVAVAIVSDLKWRDETVEYWVMPKNQNAKAIFSALPWVCPTPASIQKKFECSFGLVSSGLRGVGPKSTTEEELRINIEAVVASAVGDNSERRSKGDKVFLHPKVLVIDERRPVHPKELGVGK